MHLFSGNLSRHKKSQSLVIIKLDKILIEVEFLQIK
jgi:hypothetical protein